MFPECVVLCYCCAYRCAIAWSDPCRYCSWDRIRYTRARAQFSRRSQMVVKILGLPNDIHQIPASESSATAACCSACFGSKVLPHDSYILVWNRHSRHCASPGQSQHTIANCKCCTRFSKYPDFSCVPSRPWSGTTASHSSFLTFFSAVNIPLLLECCVVVRNEVLRTSARLIASI
jgi:hypothetical protein